MYIKIKVASANLVEIEIPVAAIDPPTHEKTGRADTARDNASAQALNGLGRGAVLEDELPRHRSRKIRASVKKIFRMMKRVNRPRTWTYLSLAALALLIVPFSTGTLSTCMAAVIGAIATVRPGVSAARAIMKALEAVHLSTWISEGVKCRSLQGVVRCATAILFACLLLLEPSAVSAAVALAGKADSGLATTQHVGEYR